MIIRKDNLFYSWKDFSKLQIIFLFLIFLFFCFLRFRYRLRPEFFSDELFTISGFRHPWKHYLFHYLRSNEFHYWGDFLLMYPIGHWISENRFVLMIPHAAAMFLFFFLFVKINWHRALSIFIEFPDPKWINVIAAAMIACNETQILHALILRPYAVLSLLSLLAYVLAYRSLNAVRFDMRLSILIFLFIIFHNYCLLMLFIGVVYVAGAQTIQIKDLSRFLTSRIHQLQIIITGLLLAIPVLTYFHQAPTLMSGYLAGSTINPHQYIKPGLNGIIQVIAICYGFKPLRTLLFCLSLFGTVLFVFNKKWKPIFFFLIWTISPIVLIYIVDVQMKYWFIQRQFLWVMPFHAVYVATASLFAVDWIYQSLKCKSHERSIA